MLTLVRWLFQKAPTHSVLESFVRRQSRIRLWLLLVLFAGQALSTASGQTYNDLYDFGGPPNGSNPYGAVTLNGSGNLYGTASSGGVGDWGMVWEITTSGKFVDLHDFGAGSDGTYPLASVTFDGSGNMYGTASDGGAHGYGMVWEITAAGSYADLHDFGAGQDGTNPQCAVTMDRQGNLYGATPYGGVNGKGMVWEISSSGNYLDLHDFGATATDGTSPEASVTLDSAGNLYGTANSGGADGNGTVWEITSAGSYLDRHDFGSVAGDGTGPQAGVTLDGSRNLYGSAYTGGANKGGMIWEITTSGKYVDLHDFGSITDDGTLPIAGVAVDSLGNLYGTASQGGAHGVGNGGDGMVWELTVSGQYIDLYDFNSRFGNFPNSNVTVAGSGNLYGTTPDGGNSGNGLVWEIVPAKPLTLSLNPSSVVGSVSSSGTVTIWPPAPTGGAVVSLTSNSSYVSVPSSITVAAGEKSASFTITTTAVDSKAMATITASTGASTQMAILTIQPVSLQSVSASLSSVVGGSTTTVVGTVTLDGSARYGGVKVLLSSSNPKFVSLPASVMIASGKSSATFAIIHRAVAGTESVTITAITGGVSQTTTLTVSPFAIASIAFSPTTVTGGIDTRGTVTLNATPTGSTGVKLVKLSSSSKFVSVPFSIGIAPGRSSATFSATTKSVSSLSTDTVTGTLGDSTKQATFTVLAPSLISVTLSPSSVRGVSLERVVGTVTLSGKSAAAGTIVNLTSSDPGDAAVPATVKVAAGSRTATFTVKHSSVSSAATVTVTASLSGVSQTATLTVKP